MRIDPDTTIWVVTDPTPRSTLPDVCEKTTLAGLHLRFLGGLKIDDNPVIFTTEDEAVKEGKNRLLVWRVAADARKQLRLPADAVVRVTLHREDDDVVFQGDVK